MNQLTSKKKGKPAWLKKSLPKGGEYQSVRDLLKRSNLTTVCQKANCPNMFECFSKNTSTFMILGSTCTRNCRFCNILNENPGAPDPEEPLRVAKAALELNLKYIVVTSVTRDDLPDGGASHFVKTIREIRKTNGQDVKIEVLIPDFQGNKDAIKAVANARPDVLNHNIETVLSLYHKVRPQADYQQSLDLLKYVKSINKFMPVKSGIMVGLGESIDELERSMQDLFDHKCTILTIGQYLQPTREHLEVVKYYTPEEFEQLEIRAKEIGFKQIASGPFVRSSYQAQDLFNSEG